MLPSLEHSFLDLHGSVWRDVERTDRDLPFFASSSSPNLTKLNDILMTYCQYNFDLGAFCLNYEPISNIYKFYRQYCIK
jgi:hypothetical protein